MQELAADYMREKGIYVPARTKRRGVPSFDEIFAQPWRALPVRNVTPKRERQTTSMASDGSFQHVSAVTTPMEATPPEEGSRSTPDAGQPMMLEVTLSSTQSGSNGTGLVTSSSGGGGDPPSGHGLPLVNPDIDMS